MSDIIKLFGKNYKKFQLKNQEKPELFRDYFPYSDVPKVLFDKEAAKLNMPEKIYISDTTFRDGQQARPPYTVKQIIDIFTLLSRLSGPNGIIRASEFFLYSNKDREAVEKLQEKGFKYPEITGWIRAVKKDFQLVKEMGLKETGILTSASDYHIYLKLKLDKKKAFEKYVDIVETALSDGIRVRCHFEDITRADIYGFALPFAQKLMQMSEEANIPIKIRLCDTMGYGLPYPEAALPRGVPKLVEVFRKEAGVPSDLLEWHGHNDFHKVLVNSVVAWLYGCGYLNGSLLGFGERTGNCPVEGAVIEYMQLKGAADGMDTTTITHIGNYFRDEINAGVPSNYPFVGKTFNTTSAGIHADGVSKNEEIYNIFDTAKILNRPIEIVVTDKSGVAGIVHWFNTYLSLNENMKVDKRHPGVKRIFESIMKDYEKGRITSISPEEMIVKGKKYLSEYFKSDFDNLKLRAEEVALHLVEDYAGRKELQRMNVSEIESMLEKVVEEDPFIQFAYVVDSNGKKFTKNISDIADRNKYETLLHEKDYSGRQWFVEPMKNGKPCVTDFYTSKITGRLCITVSAPIVDESDKIIGILGMDMKFEDLVKYEETVE
ncbi:MAG: histone-lysine N-methyltransferase [Candidatus Aureabacteria bacterium]|nr:histone-lysine N-methyltransferase [Candidatus Auribacterota bacterium]